MASSWDSCECEVRLQLWKQLANNIYSIHVYWINGHSHLQMREAEWLVCFPKVIQFKCQIRNSKSLGFQASIIEKSLSFDFIPMSNSVSHT